MLEKIKKIPLLVTIICLFIIIVKIIKIITIVRVLLEIIKISLFYPIEDLLPLFMSITIHISIIYFAIYTFLGYSKAKNIMLGIIGVYYISEVVGVMFSEKNILISVVVEIIFNSVLFAIIYYAFKKNLKYFRNE